MNPRYELSDLEDYLLHRMSPADLREFEAELATDATLVRRLDALRAEAALLQTLQTYRLKQRLVVARADRRSRFRWIRMLLILLVFGALATIFNRKYAWTTPDKTPVAPPTLPAAPAPQTLPVVPMPPVRQDMAVRHRPGNRDLTAFADSLVNNSKPQPSFRAGMRAPDSLYNLALRVMDRDAAQALQLLETSEKLDSNQVNVLRLKAYILYSLRRNPEAAQVYSRIKDHPNKMYRIDAQKAEIACFLNDLPRSRPTVDSLVRLILHGKDPLSPAQKKFTTAVLENIDDR